MAFSAGGGSFVVTNGLVGAFGDRASTAGARAIAGDFNGDGYTDVAVTGGPWASIPVAFNAGNGAFQLANRLINDLPGWSNEAAASVAVGRLD